MEPEEEVGTALPSLADFIWSAIVLARFWKFSSESLPDFYLFAQIANGLRIYFDKALRHMLLYPQEMEQAVKVQRRFVCICF